MSHLVQSKAVYNDLDSLAAACKSMGALLVRGRRKFNTYQSMCGESVYADHVIRLPGTYYEIGVQTDKKTGTYKLVYDFFGEAHEIPLEEGVRAHDGGNLQKHFGKDCHLLQMEYNRERTMRAAKAAGWSVIKKKLAGGGYNLQLVEGTTTRKNYATQSAKAW